MEDLGINVSEKVKTEETFGDMAKRLQAKGIGGTLHLVDEADKTNVVDSAWDLSKRMGLPVIIVVRGR